MGDDRARESALLLTRAFDERQCDSLQKLMAQLAVRSGAALLSRLGYIGNAEAAWEALAEAMGLALLPADPIGHSSATGCRPRKGSASSVSGHCWPGSIRSPQPSRRT